MHPTHYDFSMSADLFQNTRSSSVLAAVDEVKDPRTGIFNHLVENQDDLILQVTRLLSKQMAEGKIPRFSFTVATQDQLAKKYLDVQIISAPEQLLSFPQGAALEVLQSDTDDLCTGYLMLPPAKRITAKIHRALWAFNRDLAKGELDIFGRLGQVFFKSSVRFSPRLIRRWALSQAKGHVKKRA